MAVEMDYCQDCFSACTNKTVPVRLRKEYKTTEDIMKAYESSSCFAGKPEFRDRYLIRCVSSFMEQTSFDFYNLDADAERILQRSINGIKNASNHVDIFAALSDFLWIEASRNLFFRDNVKGNVGLIENVTIENLNSAEKIMEIKRKIEKAKYDLCCMEEADRLPWYKHFFLGLVCNPDVKQYTNDYFTPSQRKDEICAAKNYISKTEMVYYAFLATNFYQEVLRRRYQ